MNKDIRQLLRMNKKTLLLIAAVLLLGTAVTVSERNQAADVAENGVARGSVGSNALSETFTYRVDGGEEYEITLDVQAQQLTEEEAMELLAEAEAAWEEVYLGENASAGAVTKDLDLPDTLMDGLVEVSYTFDDYSVIAEDGVLQQENTQEDGTLVQMTAEFGYEDYSLLETKNLLILPAELTEEEALQQEVEEALLSEEGSTREQASFLLPSVVGDHTVSWSVQGSHAGIWVILLGICAVIALQFKQRQDMRQKEKERKKRLLLEYPQMAEQMALLLGSGMTVLHAWDRMIQTGSASGSRKAAGRPLYITEMEVTLREIREGHGEVESYKRFSQRIGLEPYRRLISILTQNLSKGNRQIQAVLEQEASDALQLRRNNAKRMGEEAGSKLFGPMMLLFVLILLVVLWPAVSNIGL